MNVAAALALLDAAAGTFEQLPLSCCVIKETGDGFEPVGYVEKKLSAFVREYDRGGILFRHPSCTDSKPFRKHFDRVIEVEDIEDLQDELRWHGIVHALRRQARNRQWIDNPGHGEAFMHISPNDWQWMLHSDSPQDRTYLDSLASRCLDDEEVWEEYLEETREYVNTEPVVLDELRAQISWLRRCQPAARNDRLDLIHATLRLIERSYSGGFSSRAMATIEECMPLVRSVWPELACWAQIHAASAHINRFDFDTARQVLSEAPPPEGLAARTRGRHLSLAGELHAFAGDGSKARARFDAAQRQFALGNDEDTQAAMQRTSRLAAHTIMDDPLADKDDARIRLSVAHGAHSFDELLRLVAGHDDPAGLDLHHTVVRLLAKAGTPEERAAYLDQADRWPQLDRLETPWECILFYRATLLRDAGRESWYDELSPLVECLGDGSLSMLEPLRRLRALAFLNVAGSWGLDLPKMNPLLEELQEDLPLAAQRINGLKSRQDREWQALLQDVIPFRFH